MSWVGEGWKEGVGGGIGGSVDSGEDLLLLWNVILFGQPDPVAWDDKAPDGISQQGKLYCVKHSRNAKSHSDVGVCSG